MVSWDRSSFVDARQICKHDFLLPFLPERPAGEESGIE